MNVNDPLSVFEPRDAEEEGPLLDQVIVEPKVFSAIKSSRPVLIFGGSGYGKSALEINLKRYALEQHILVAEWDFSFIYDDRLAKSSEDPNTKTWVKYQLDSIAKAVALHLLEQIDELENWDDWVLETFFDFMLINMLSPVSNFLLLQRKLFGSETVKQLINILDQHNAESLLSSLGVISMLRELMAALREIDIGGIWVFFKDVAPYSNTNKQKTSKILIDLFGSLKLFEVTAYTPKLILPDTLRAVVASNNSTTRRRVDIHTLTWRYSDLVEMLRARTLYALEVDSFSFSQIYDENVLFNWIDNCGERSPADWKKYFHPVFEQFLTVNQSRIRDEDWIKIIQANSPKLWIDKKSKRIYRGFREIVGLTGMLEKVFLYLYEKREQVISREELYYFGCLGIPADNIRSFENISSKYYEPPKTVRQNIDTHISRLRDLIEPLGSAKFSVYIQTHRGKGYVLKNSLAQDD